MSWTVTVYYNGEEANVEVPDFESLEDANDFVARISRHGYTYTDDNDVNFVPKHGIDYCKIEEE